MAFGSGTAAGVGGAVSDIFAGMGASSKAKGLKLEAQQYRRSAAFSLQQAELSRQSTAIKDASLLRQMFMVVGGTQAALGAAGFSGGGSATDIMAMNASQAAMERATAHASGLVQEEGYKVQAENYQSMAKAADAAAKAAKSSEIGSYISAGIKLAGAVVTL